MYRPKKSMTTRLTNSCIDKRHKKYEVRGAIKILINVESYEFVLTGGVYLDPKLLKCEGQK